MIDYISQTDYLLILKFTITFVQNDYEAMKVTKIFEKLDNKNVINHELRDPISTL